MQCKRYTRVSNMKYSFLLFFICAVQTVLSEMYRGPPISLESPVLLGSIRDLNSGLPKCIGTFVTSDTLVTTARCLACGSKCNLTVYTNYPNVLMTVQYKVKSIKIHETFKMDHRRNDIGLVLLEQSVPGSVVVELPDKKISLTKLWAYSFAGRSLFKKYYFEAKKVKVMSSAACTFALHKYIPQSQVCAYTIRKHCFKKQDQGSPLIYFQKGKMYLLGRYVIDNFRVRQGMRIVVYQAIFSHIKWINKNAKNKTDDPECITAKPTVLETTSEHLNITAKPVGTTLKPTETSKAPATATVSEATKATNAPTTAAAPTTMPSITTVDF